MSQADGNLPTEPVEKDVATKLGLGVSSWNGGAGGAAGAVAPSATVPLAALLTTHLLQDGEIVLFVLKPSIWFVMLSTLRTAAVVCILMISSVLFDHELPGPVRAYVEAGMFILAGRITIALLQWMSRLYILTDLRIVRLSGVFNLTIFDCPLRRVARTRILYTMRERILRLGSIEIIPADEEIPICIWQTVARPLAVNDQIVAAINRAKGRSIENAA